LLEGFINKQTFKLNIKNGDSMGYFISSIPPESIKSSSVFNLSDLYKFVYKWCELNSYEVKELEYYHGDEQAGNHIEVRLEATKNMDSYIRRRIMVSFLVLGMNKVEVEHEGMKLKTNKGNVEIQIEALLDLGYDRKWEKFGILRKIYDKFIIVSRLKAQKSVVGTEAYGLGNEIKAFLKLYQF